MGRYIRQLPAAESITENDYFVTDDGMHNYKIRWKQLKALLNTVVSLEVDPDQTHYPGGLLLTLNTGEEIRVTPSDPNKLDKRDFDRAPTENSENLLTSGTVFAALTLLLPKADYKAFTGATGQAAGAAGIVPAPAAGTDRVLCSDGTWKAVDDSPSQDSDHLVKSGGVWDAIQRGGGSGGTSNYNDLENRPQIGGVTLSGNKTAAQLGLVAAEEGKGLSSNDFTTALKTVLEAVSALVVPANNGKVIGIVDGALAAVEGGSTLEAWTGGSF